MKTKTFTLIELILVVAIIALLAGAMVPMILSARQKARIS
ncbi:MAG: prepilin-type N-terminal cleavage/methylation domain-containing protein, partial [Candidatus Omnitrophica bacterium]|nr:prepilin-type N-terminal cleavage/methylation domain-containing protein [Candidatus Omnitrophota bacterium]